LDNFYFLALGTLANFTLLVARMTSGFTIIASMHQFDLATRETLLVRGRIIAIAVFTDGLAGLAVFVNLFVLSTDTANAF